MRIPHPLILEADFENREAKIKRMVVLIADGGLIQYLCSTVLKVFSIRARQQAVT